MKIITIILLSVFISCKKKDHCGIYVGNEKLGLDNYWRKVTGYDSLQIYCGAGDKLNYNFCYPNEFNPYEYEKHKKDTVFIHDTVVVVDIGYGSKKDSALSIDVSSAYYPLNYKQFTSKSKKKKRKIKIDKLYADTVFANFPIYIDTTVMGKRILKLMK